MKGGTTMYICLKCGEEFDNNKTGSEECPRCGSEETIINREY